MRRKDALELAFWKQADLAYHRAKLSIYLWAWGCYNMPQMVLEIGCGPLGGFLPLLTRASYRIGVDPLAGEYQRAGLLNEPGIVFASEHFEDWKPTDGSFRFDAIFAADALDHGEMGFDLIPKIADLLYPGGRFFLHVHLRPPERLNESHDHGLTVPQLEAALKKTNLIERKLEFYADDVDGAFGVNALVGVWERPR